MARLDADEALEHNFGRGKHEHLPLIGKMFGVLLIQDRDGNLGYLCAVSGKLANSNEHSFLVPPVFDMLAEESFFLQEMEVITRLNKETEEWENDPAYIALQARYKTVVQTEEAHVLSVKAEVRRKKELRKKSREENLEQEEELVRQSLADKRGMNEELRASKERVQTIAAELGQYEARINALKAERKKRSAEIQEDLFSQYSFLNAHGEQKSLWSIFKDTVYGKPPAAAGECATPKLLQYAYSQGYRPLAMAEFWWGTSPKSEVRKHGQYYPACRGKCEPILSHMLQGLEVDDNPLLSAADVPMEILYEDPYLAVVNKPSGLLSVPGIHILDSVYSRLKARWDHSAPFVVHRLDQDTSGILVMARDKAVHKAIQSQFIKRTVEKQYIAVLDGVLPESEGEIKLPLRGDLDDRPRQLVCYEHGKYAHTRWEKLRIEENRTVVRFYPLTGRTHQLRVHAAHHEGLNAPIVGDELYGKAAARLCLHAAFLEFYHPIRKERMQFEVSPSF